MTGVELVGEFADRGDEARELEDVVSREREGCAEGELATDVGSDTASDGRGCEAAVGTGFVNAPSLFEFPPSNGLVPKLFARRMRVLGFVNFLECCG